jgi:hypothetical protein
MAWILFKLHSLMLNYYSESLHLGAALKLLVKDNFKLGGSVPTTTRHGSYGSLISGATCYKSTQMMAFVNTEDHGLIT